MTRKKMLIIIAISAVVVLTMATLIGPSELNAKIFFKLRLPRVLTAFLAGGGLALCGMALQAMFRNSLASPFTLGISSGASLGAVIYIITGLPLAALGTWGASVFSFAGAVVAILLVYGLTKVRRGFSTATMLLAGVAVNFFFSSVILFLQYISDHTQSYRFIHWTMGHLGTVGYGTVLNIFGFVIVGAAVVFYLTNELNLLTTGDDIAASRGVDVKKTKRLLFFATSIMVGGIVAFCGPIGFVGLMAPHICRLMIGPDHRYLSSATLLFGGLFLVLCDMFARIIISPVEIPVGVITAMLGGPFFVWLLLRGSADKKLL